MLGPELKPDSTPVETVYEYTDNDQIQRVSVVASPAQVISEWTYDAGHRKRTMTMGNGAVQTTGYDAKERLASIVTRKSDTTVLSSFVYSYNARDERTGMALAHLSSSVVFGYDALGRLNAETWSGSLAFAGTYGYDPAGNRNFKSTPAGTFVLGLDADNRATSESVVSGSEEIFGIPVVDSTKPGHSSSVLNDRDLSDSPSANKCWRSGDATVQHFAGLALFAPKPIGKVIFYIPTQGNRGMARFKVQVGDGASFTDAVPTSLIGASPSATPGWLQTNDVHEVTIEFVALFGNHVRVLMDAGGGSSSHPNTMWLNEFRAFSVGATTLVSSSEFDENGSMTSRTTGSTVESYTYTFRNELATYTKTESAVTTASFSYSFGPRSGDRMNKMNLVTGVTEWYMMEGRDTVADYETTSSTLSFSYKRRYVNALGIDSKLARMEAGGTLLWYSSDAIGSISQTLDSSQAIVNRQQANAWGEDLEFSQAVADRHGFAQREKDVESSLMHYRARSYDPRIGRFIQKDPPVERRSEFHYLYASNSPTSRRDPTGTQDVDPEVQQAYGTTTILSGAELAAEKARAAAMAKRAEQPKYAMTSKRVILQSGKVIFIKAGYWLGALESEIEFRKELRDQISHHEGGRFKHVYLDNATPRNRTIGIGFNLERGNARERIRAVGADYDKVLNGEADLTDAQIDALFDRDVHDAILGANKRLTNYQLLPKQARLVVVDMVFNLGEAGFGNFKILRAAIETRDWQRAADEMKNSRWYAQVKSRGVKLEQMMRGITEK